MPGITALFLPAVPPLGLGAAWGWAWCPPAFACLLLPRAPLVSSGTRQLGASLGIRVPSFQGTVSQLCPDARSFYTIRVSKWPGGDHALGQGRRQGGFFVNTLPSLHLQLKAGGQAHPGEEQTALLDTMMAKPAQLCKSPFPPRWCPTFVWEAGGATSAVTQSPVLEGAWWGLRDWFCFAHCWGPTDLSGALQMYVILKSTTASLVLALPVAGCVTLGKVLTKWSSGCLPSLFPMRKSSPRKVSFNCSPFTRPSREN